MKVLDEFQCINCEFMDEYFRDSSSTDVTQVCPNCGNTMTKVINPPVINDSKSLTFVNISPERKFEIKRERLAVKGKFNKSKKVREEAKAAAADMSNFKS